MDQLPDNIDGKIIYMTPDTTTNKNVVTALQDGRKWNKNCPTSWKDHVHIGYADCKGSHKCARNDCPFKVKSVASPGRELGDKPPPPSCSKNQF